MDKAISRCFGLGVGLLTLAVAACAQGAAITGVIRDPAGKPVANAFVTTHNAARKVADTVLSDAGGRYSVTGLFPGDYTVRARRQGYADVTRDSIAVTEEVDREVNLQFAGADTMKLSEPGSAWLAALPNDLTKAAFVTACTICHDAGSPLTRGPHDATGWEAVIHAMRTQADIYSVIVPFDDRELARWLVQNKMGANIAGYDLFRRNASVVTDTRITEYEVGDVTSWAHDMAIEPATGAAWVGDYVKDELIRVDPRTGAQRVIPGPVRQAGMHTLNFDRDGYLWITFQLADMVGRFDPRTEQWRIYGGFAKHTLVHSFALDTLGYVLKSKDGRIWMSQFGGNRISSLDPMTGRIDEVTLPGEATGRPYGVALDSAGRLWFTKYSENLMGWVDPATGQGKEWALARPHSGPHRMHIDDADNLWIPLSGYGTVLMHNARTSEEREFALPDPDSFPYVVRYDRRSQRVWITGNGANSIYALDPTSGKVKTFRLPSYLSYGRMISIDYSNGDVWTALSSYPNNHALRDHGLLLRLHGALRQVTP